MKHHLPPLYQRHTLRAVSSTLLPVGSTSTSALVVDVPASKIVDGFFVDCIYSQPVPLMSSQYFHTLILDFSGGTLDGSIMVANDKASYTNIASVATSTTPDSVVVRFHSSQLSPVQLNPSAPVGFLLVAPSENPTFAMDTFYPMDGFCYRLTSVNVLLISLS